MILWLAVINGIIMKRVFSFLFKVITTLWEFFEYIVLIPYKLIFGGSPGTGSKNPLIHILQGDLFWFLKKK